MKIVHYPHPALRHKSRPVTSIDKQLHLHIGEMMELMYDAKGLGLAAPQVALPFQLLVMNITGDPNQPECEEVFLNPLIVERKGFMEDEEGCLSFPGLYQKVRRAKTIKVQAYNLKGELIEKVVSDLEPRAWQHEIDHLNGILYIDMMGPLASWRAATPSRNSSASSARPRERARSRPTPRSRSSSPRSRSRTHERTVIARSADAHRDDGHRHLRRADLRGALDGPHQVVGLFTQPDRPTGQGARLAPARPAGA